MQFLIDVNDNEEDELDVAELPEDETQEAYFFSKELEDSGGEGLGKLFGWVNLFLVEARGTQEEMI